MDADGLSDVHVGAFVASRWPGCSSSSYVLPIVRNSTDELPGVGAGGHFLHHVFTIGEAFCRIFYDHGSALQWAFVDVPEETVILRDMPIAEVPRHLQVRCPGFSDDVLVGAPGAETRLLSLLRHLCETLADDDRFNNGPRVNCVWQIEQAPGLHTFQPAVDCGSSVAQLASVLSVSSPVNATQESSFNTAVDAEHDALASDSGDAAQRALLAIINKRNVFLTGGAGCGKSTTLMEAVARCREMGRVAAVCSLGGMAASQINGVTLHSWCGFKAGHLGTGARTKELLGVIHPMGRRRIREVDVFFLDEVSFVSATLLGEVDGLFRTLRPRKDLPFGGAQVVFCGDFFQLPPTRGAYAFFHPVWTELFGRRAFVLRKAYRAAGDPELLDLLEHARLGRLEDRHVHLLQSRSCSRPPADVLVLFPTWRKVNTLNASRIKELGAKVHTFTAADSSPHSMTPAALKAMLDEATRVPQVLDLCVGARVVLLTNKHRVSSLLPAGSTGTVLSFRTAGGGLSSHNVSVPLVRFLNLNLTPVDISVYPERFDVCGVRDGLRPAATRMQVPVCLGWAMVIHKSQGLTIPAVAVDVSEAFAAGMVYVALSRVCYLSTLLVIGLDRDKLYASADVTAFYEALVSM